MTIVETTRLCPFPFPIWKTCTESIDLTDYDGRSVHIEKGVKIILPINALHSHPDFYSNPDKFDPQRFDESTGGAKRLKDAGVFMPFGNGPVSYSLLCFIQEFNYYFLEFFPSQKRQCLGMRFAIAQIKTALYTLVGNFEFSLRPSSDAPSSPTGMLFFSQNVAELEIKRL